MADLPSDLDPVLCQRILSLEVLFFDFDGVFTDNRVYVFEDGREAVRCCRADGLGLRRLERSGVMPMILSTETNPVVAMRAKKLEVTCYPGLEDKAARMAAILNERHLDASQAGFLGNDINDLSCLVAVGLPMVVADAHHDVADKALYTTRTAGGCGAVREVCDLIGTVRENSEAAFS